MSRVLVKESIYLDYKASLDLSAKDAASELASDIVQFANSFGGELVVGISEDKKLNRFEVIGCKNSEKIREFVHNSVLPLIHPQSINPDILLEEVDGKEVLIVKVAPLVEGVGFVIARQNEHLKVPYRADYGKKYMSAGEIEKRMDGSSRRAYLKLMSIGPMFRAKKVQFTSPVLVLMPGGELRGADDLYQFSFDSFREDYVVMVGSHHTFHVPYSQIEDIWEGVLGEICLMLKVDLVAETSRDGFLFKLRKSNK